MHTVVVEGIDGVHIGLVREAPSGQYDISGEDKVQKAIQEIIAFAKTNGILLRSHSNQRTKLGMRYMKTGIWVKPGEPGFLPALADRLLEYDLFAYPMEDDNNS